MPCCFLGGISGQFFRQFAVTIAVSTIISAINALTMTPSRAVLIFKTEEGTTATSTRNAKRCRGGSSACWAACSPSGWARHSWPASFGLPRGRRRRRDAEAPTLAAVGCRARVYFLPGALVGGLIGWFIIRPVNAVLGWFFRGFNRSSTG